MRPTTARDGNVINFNTFFKPATVFEHPKDVVCDESLTTAEKRTILASWASDASAVVSCPALRALPGAKSPVPIDEILEALRALDGDDGLPPGGKPMRLRATERMPAAA